MNAAIEGLRTTSANQIFGRRTDYRGGRCAVGVIAETVYGDVAYALSFDPEWNTVLIGHIIHRNDDLKMTFAQIANKLEQFADQYITMEDVAEVA